MRNVQVFLITEMLESTLFTVSMLTPFLQHDHVGHCPLPEVHWIRTMFQEMALHLSSGDRSL